MSVAGKALGIGWRSEIALLIERRKDLAFIEVLAESFDRDRPLPEAIQRLLARGVLAIPHGVSLSLGSAERPDPGRLQDLSVLAERLGAPMISEHIAFVRGGGIETGHLLPVPRTKEVLEIVVANVREAKAALPVPLVVENIATLFEWQDTDMDDADFLSEVLERCDVGLLLDVANLHANSLNHRFDPFDFLDRIPLERIAYVHVAGGMRRGALYHDTHAHDVPREVLELLGYLAGRADVPGVMLERDDCFPNDADINAELDAIAATVASARPSAASNAAVTVEAQHAGG